MTNSAMNEIAPGIVHWKAKHPSIGADVSCYYLPAERVLIDPMEPEEGLDWFRENGPPEHILLSNRHHDRDSAKFVDGVRLHGPREPSGHARVLGRKSSTSSRSTIGDELPGGVKAYEAGAICPDDTVLHIPARSALSVADGVINYGGLGFVPEEHLGDDVDAMKQEIRESYGKLAAELDFDNLLVAHGEPVVGGARDELARFAEG